MMPTETRWALSEPARARQVAQRSTGTVASVTASWARQVSLVRNETNRSASLTTSPIHGGDHDEEAEQRHVDHGKGATAEVPNLCRRKDLSVSTKGQRAPGRRTIDLARPAVLSRGRNANLHGLPPSCGISTSTSIRDRHSPPETFVLSYDARRSDRRPGAQSAYRP